MDVGRGDRAIGARTVLDDDRLPERLAQRIGKDAAERIAGAAGPEYGNHSDRPGRIILRAYDAAETYGRGGGDENG